MKEGLSRTSALGFPVDTDATCADIIRMAQHAVESSQCVLFTFVNPYSTYIGKKDERYFSELGRFDGVFGDGIGVVLGGRLLGVRELRRISFDSTSLAPHVFDYCTREGIGLFIIGGADGVSTRASETIRCSYPSLVILGAHSGYFSDESEAIASIKESGAKVLICGMGAPLQERFMLRLRDSGWTGVGFTCGGYLDQLSQGFDYYPKIIDLLNARFLYRLYKEPSRLWKRYLLHYPLFLFDVFERCVRFKFSRVF